MLAGDWWRREPAERPSFERITARLCLQGSSNERRRSALSQLLSGCCQDCQAYLARYGRGVGPAVRNLVLQARGGVAVVYCGACAIAGKVVGPVGAAVRGGVMRASAAATRLGDTRIPLSAVALDVAFPRFHVVVHAFQCACELTLVYPHRIGMQVLVVCVAATMLARVLPSKGDEYDEYACKLVQMAVSVGMTHVALSLGALRLLVRASGLVRPGSPL